MTRLNIVLLALLIASALYLVRVAYEGRRLYAELDRARTEQNNLDTAYKRLVAERQTQGTTPFVERTARERLRMRAAGAPVTQYITDTATGGQP